MPGNSQNFLQQQQFGQPEFLQPEYQHNPAAPLAKAENAFVISSGKKLQLSEMAETLKNLNSILNKMTPYRFDKLATKVCDLKMVDTTMLRCVVTALFDKALNEPAFGEMYARLCIRLHEDSSAKGCWPFIKFVYHTEAQTEPIFPGREMKTDRPYWWCTDKHAMEEVVGPFQSFEDMMRDALTTEEPEYVTSPKGLVPDGMTIEAGQYIKTTSLDGQYFYSAEPITEVRP
jgi:translation initiation factor 4G